MITRDVSRGELRRIRPWILIDACAVAVVAVVAGLAWNALVDLPAYSMVGKDLQARISEVSLSRIVAADVYFCLVGLVGGLLLGVTAWLLFRRLGWPVTLIAAGGSALAGLLARLVGQFIGPRDFEERIASATLGDTVTVDFGGHTWVPLAVWAGVAVVPVIFGAMLRPQQWVKHTPADDQTAPPPGASVKVG